MYYLLIKDREAKRLVPYRVNLEVPLWVDFDDARNHADKLLANGENEVAVLYVYTEEIVAHYLKTPQVTINLLEPPPWVLDFLGMVSAVESCTSMSDRDAMEHELARTVLTFQKDILGVWKQ